jgi:predicted component of type VI protein secretion system
MKYSLVLILIVVMTGCASERSNRTIQQILSPDKLNMQLHVNPDINHNLRDDTEIQQVRIGLDWDL